MMVNLRTGDALAKSGDGGTAAGLFDRLSLGLASIDIGQTSRFRNRLGV
jgi:hypothetical protein